MPPRLQLTNERQLSGHRSSFAVCWQPKVGDCALCTAIARSNTVWVYLQLIIGCVGRCLPICVSIQFLVGMAICCMEHFKVEGRERTTLECAEVLIQQLVDTGSCPDTVCCTLYKLCKHCGRCC